MTVHRAIRNGNETNKCRYMYESIF